LRTAEEMREPEGGSRVLILRFAHRLPFVHQPAAGSAPSRRGRWLYLIDPRVTPEMTHRCEKMYTISSGAIAIRYDANATV